MKELEETTNKNLKDFLEEDAPANAVGDGSAVAMPPAHEPGVHVKKKKKKSSHIDDVHRVNKKFFIDRLFGIQ